MDGPVMMALVPAALVMIFPVAFIWYSVVGGVYQHLRDKRINKLECSIDFDCPPGYKCLNGKCVASTG
ncbi:hypothetical protein ACFLYM_02305 [Chloroflexota bacterium]